MGNLEHWKKYLWLLNSVCLFFKFFCLSTSIIVVIKNDNSGEFQLLCVCDNTVLTYLDLTNLWGFFFCCCCLFCLFALTSVSVLILRSGKLKNIWSVRIIKSHCNLLLVALTVIDPHKRAFWKFDWGSSVFVELKVQRCQHYESHWWIFELELEKEKAFTRQSYSIILH